MSYPIVTVSGAEVDLAAALRRTKATALREYADRHHFGENRSPWVGTEPHEAYGVCVCGTGWAEDEDGCPERVQLLADADRIEKGETL